MRENQQILPIRAVKKIIGEAPSDSPKIRKAGGGRKPYWISNPKIDEQFDNIVKIRSAYLKAGNPDRSLSTVLFEIQPY